MSARFIDPWANTIKMSFWPVIEIYWLFLKFHISLRLFGLYLKVHKNMMMSLDILWLGLMTFESIHQYPCFCIIQPKFCCPSCFSWFYFLLPLFFQKKSIKVAQLAWQKRDKSYTSMILECQLFFYTVAGLTTSLLNYCNYSTIQGGPARSRHCRKSTSNSDFCFYDWRHYCVWK